MNEITHTIILWGGVAGAIVAIIALIVKAVNAVKNGVSYFTDLKKSVNTLIEHDHTHVNDMLQTD